MKSPLEKKAERPPCAAGGGIKLQGGLTKARKRGTIPTWSGQVLSCFCEDRRAGLKPIVCTVQTTSSFRRHGRSRGRWSQETWPEKVDSLMGRTYHAVAKGTTCDMVGQLVAGYQVLGKLGSGGMGAVCLEQDAKSWEGSTSCQLSKGISAS